ncbi:chromosome partitioning protein [Rhodoligotrophos appendicifer]|uniref:ParA family partition ATPase n=1 Tax=Rhodoligotrophos appendicifer TaxID=987056 RepID=UPI001185F5EA|nr:ParA family partition ATPase [Rhodoligotrophos appendicifer]
MTGRIITLAQQKGGSGKTTIAAHLAVAFHLQGLRVAIVDVDPQGSLGEWFEARERRMADDAGLSFRTASGWGARRAARALARDFDIVVVDTPPKSDVEAKSAIETANLVVVPIQPTHVDLWATKPTLDLIGQVQVPSLLILNRVLSRVSLTGEMAAAMAEFGHPAASNTIGNRVGFAASMGEGSTLLEREPGSKGSAELQAVALEVIDHLVAADGAQP